MACISGKNGALSLDGGVSNIAQLTSWTINQSAEVATANFMGNDWACNKSGTLAFEGSCEAIFDTGEVYPILGAEVAMIAYETGTTTTYNGSVIITSIETSVGVDDIITTSMSFTGDGALTVA
jgi:hypothetical protein